MRLVTGVTVLLTLGKCSVSARDDLKLKDGEGSLSSIIVMELRNDLWFVREHKLLLE